jgi:fermentation-respiration switch protein FrsA (DUF1100 family)
LVAIWVAVPPCSGFPPVVLATEAVRAVFPLSFSAVTRISSVCPLLAVTGLLTAVVVPPPAALPLDAAASAALMPSKITGLERIGVSVPTLVRRVLVVKV